MINERRRHNSGSIQQLTCPLCDAQWFRHPPENGTVRDQLLAMIVVVGALVAGWMVVSGTRRNNRGRGSTSGSSGGDGGDGSWFSGHSSDHGSSGDHGSGGDSGGGDGGGEVAGTAAATDACCR